MEYFDTGNDPRLKFATNYTDKLLNMVKSRKLSGIRKSELLEILESINKSLKQLRWSYLPKQQLIESETYKQLESLMERLNNFLESKSGVFERGDLIVKKSLEFLYDNLTTLKERILSGDEDPVNAVDYYYVKVIEKEKHPKAEKLYVTYVTNGEKNLKVVTNDESIKPRDIVILARLPPRDFMGEISEGMFVGSNGLRREKNENLIGQKPILLNEEKKKIIKEIYEYLG